MDRSAVTREDVHDALETLYDNVRLADSALATGDPQLAALQRLEERADRTRALLLEAIEVLRPARVSAFGAPESRAYDLLTLRYVENLPLSQVMEELSLSRRQVYRDLADAEERLTQVLRSWAGVSSRAELVTGAVGGLGGDTEEVDLRQTLTEALELVASLAQECGVALETESLEGGAEALPVLGDAVLLRQTVVQALSATLQSQPRGPVRLGTRATSDGVVLRLLFEPKPGGLRQDMLETLAAMAGPQGVSCQAASDPAGLVTLTLGFMRRETSTVLVIEDNAEVVELYRRFLAGSRWRVITVVSPSLALEEALRARPMAILLDILMPGFDGWSIIRSLQEHEDTAGIPIIVCSVLEDPSLAMALGASAYLSKPLTGRQLLATLEEAAQTAS